MGQVMQHTDIFRDSLCRLVSFNKRKQWFKKRDKTLATSGGQIN